MVQSSEKKFPLTAKDYELYEEVGKGVQDDTNEDSSMREANANRRSDAGSPVDEIYSKQEAIHPNAASQQEDEVNDIDDLENSFAAFPVKSLQALKGYFDVRDEDNGTDSSNSRDSARSDPEQQSEQLASASAVNEEFGRADTMDSGKRGHLPYSVTTCSREAFSGSLLPDKVFSPRKFIGDADREYLPPRSRTERNYSGPLQYRPKTDLSTIPGEDAFEGAAMERRGRFKVTPADLNYKRIANYSPISSVSSSLSVLPSLQWILQHNAMQREEIAKLMVFVEQTSGNASGLMNDISEIAPVFSAKERELQACVMQLQQSIHSQAEELQKLRSKNSQMERKLSAKYSKDDELQEHRGG